MKIAIFGLGYVGSVSAACLAKLGHSVIGVDPQSTKVDLVNRGRAPIIEPLLEVLVAEAVKSGRLVATEASERAVREADLSMVCVGTPSLPNGDVDVRGLARACMDIGEALRRKGRYHVVVVRSTMLPGTMRDIVRPALAEASGLEPGADFGLAVNPEFLREGTAVADFHTPPKTVIGGLDARSVDVVAELYAGLDAPLMRTSIEVAEMIKYVDNAWHALKVSFSNEIGNLCKALSVDSHRVMEIFCADTKLNLSAAYLKPGFAFGGSCLPKDLRALIHKAKMLDLTLPVLESVIESNRLQIERAIARIVSLQRRRIGILGISFKAGTDDLRESPMIDLAERLLGKGFELRLFDRNVSLARVVGANRDYIVRTIPHISNLMVENISEVLEYAQVIVVGNKDQEFDSLPTRLAPDQYLVDMVRLSGTEALAGRYDGINW
ncbi:MAG: nucleotide sugar dehydrogenase [Dongiaceae bacterium]